MKRRLTRRKEISDQERGRYKKDNLYFIYSKPRHRSKDYKKSNKKLLYVLEKSITKGNIANTLDITQITYGSNKVSIQKRLIIDLEPLIFKKSKYRKTLQINYYDDGYVLYKLRKEYYRQFPK